MGRYIVDERCLAKVKGTLVLRAVVRLIRPEQAVVTAVDELEDLGQATHATVFVQEGHATREREPHVFVVEREALKGRAGVQNASKSAETSVRRSVVASSKAGGSGVGKGGIEAWMVTRICGKISGPNIVFELHRHTPRSGRKAAA